MKFFILFCFVASALAQQYPILSTDSNCGKGTNYPALNKITGGTIVSKGNFGWTVIINYNGQLLCSGALVNSIWVVTSASCVYGKNLNGLSVDIGVQDRNAWDAYSVTRRALTYVVHNGYQPTTFRNDMAMIKLSTPVNMDTITFKVVPICIPSGLEYYEGRNGYITGYGSSYSGGPSSRYLMQVYTRILTSSACIQKFGAFNYAIDSNYQICAGDNFQNQDFCDYDAGSPLTVKGSDGRWHLVGIASFGRNPCGNGGVYSRVSAYGSFILFTMNNN